MIGIDQNLFIKEYRKQVDKESLSQMQDYSISNMLNAFGQLNQTYSVMFKDICLTFGALLSIKEELKDHCSDQIVQQNQTSIQEQILQEKLHQQEQHMETIQQQLKIAQIQIRDQDKMYKSSLLERDIEIKEYKQRLQDLQENEQKQIKERAKLQSKIQQIEEKINNNQQNEQINITENKISQQNGYKISMLSNDRNKDNITKQPSLNKNENLVYQVKEYTNQNQVGKSNSIQNKYQQEMINDAYPNNSLLNENRQQQQQQEINKAQMQEKKQDNSNLSKVNAIMKSYTEQNKIELQQNINQQNYNDNQFNGTKQNGIQQQNDNNSRKFADENIFIEQKREAELKKRKMEEDHMKNQKYVSSLNYTKIISDSIKAQNQQNRSNEMPTSTIMLNRIQSESTTFNQNNQNGRMDIENNEFDKQVIGNRMNQVDQMQLEQQEKAENQRGIKSLEEIENLRGRQLEQIDNVSGRLSTENLRGRLIGETENERGSSLQGGEKFIQQDEEIDLKYMWNQKNEQRNLSLQSLQGINQQNNDVNNQNGSEHKKRFKKQNLKKPDQMIPLNQQAGEIENSISSIVNPPQQQSTSNIQQISQQQQQQQMQQQMQQQIQQQQQQQQYQQEQYEASTNQHLLGQKKNLNLNKSRSNTTNFMKDINFEEENDEKQQPEGNNLFAQFEFKKKANNPAQISSVASNNNQPQQHKRQLNIRKKADRENLKGYNCGRCKAMHDNLGEDFCGNCSRHKAEYTPPHTPNAHYQKFSQSEDDSAD